MKNNYFNELNRLFNERQVLNMPAIRQSIPGRSKCSLFRDLKSMGYLSSYNKAGSYYTLRSIAQFDEAGIWKHEGVYFSVYGSLKNTLKDLIDTSKAGYTHSELQQLLGVRVHNTLLDLVSINKIWRESFDGAYLYTHTSTDIKMKQLEERLSVTEKPPFDPYLAIDILRAVIKHPEKSVRDIHHYLAKCGRIVKMKEVEDVFSFYDLGKKN